MSHGITSTDNVLLHNTPAWHSLGLIIKGEAPTPRDGLLQIGAEWGVEQRSLFVLDSAGKQVVVPTHVANYRADIGNLLGVVSAGYQPIQNIEVADFCSALLGEGESKVRCESIGTIWGGKRIWFLLKGEQFRVGRNDAVYPYILVSNGHDGETTFRVTPTTVRVVCQNTMHMVIPHFDTGELGNAAISIRHTVNVMDRLEEARKALAHYGETLEAEKRLCGTLSAKDVSREDVQKFFLECYSADFGEVPANPGSKVEENRRNRAMSAYDSFSRRFDDESGIAGTNYWNALNAYSGSVQHSAKARGKDDADRVGKRIESNVFGLNQKRTQDALKRAFKLALTA